MTINEVSALKVGDRVQHPTLGGGTVHEKVAFNSRDWIVLKGIGGLTRAFNTHDLNAFFLWTVYVPYQPFEGEEEAPLSWFKKDKTSLFTLKEDERGVFTFHSVRTNQSWAMTINSVRALHRLFERATQHAANKPQAATPHASTKLHSR